MRVVLFDGIQETHVASSLERALVAAGHEVYNTGRFGSGFVFRKVEDLEPVLSPHLERIREFRPDLVFVFRPGSAPLPVMEVLRSTGAVLAAWLSDDPVLFDLSYGPVIDLYDLVLHCGNASVLRFYEERFERPTGVNFPFWTDHTAFPTVYGTQPPDTTVLFLGNVDGPIRGPRYDTLAALHHQVRIFGQVGADPRGMGSGFLDTDAEVVEASSRTRVALNIPQFFRHHRGLQTWFPGLDDLGFFDLPSRVIQYAAMGLPTLNIIPGVTSLEAFPEMVVCGSAAEADAWIETALSDGRLPELSRALVERFDRSFSAAARVMALESLVAEDTWRHLDAEERALWFTQFDGRKQESGSGSRMSPGPLEVRGPADPEEQIPFPPMAVVTGRDPVRFDALDVVLREVGDSGGNVTVLGPDRLEGALMGASPLSPGQVEGHALLRMLDDSPPSLILFAGGIRLSDDGARTLREAGIATICLVSDESVTAAEASLYDLLVRVGHAPADRLAVMRGLPRYLHSPGLVESRFLEAVSRLQPVPGVLALTSSDARPLEGWVIEAVSTVAGSVTELSQADLAEAGPDRLATSLSRQLVYVQPVDNRGLSSHPPITPYALCAAPSLLTSRRPAFLSADLYGDWVTMAASTGETSLKLAREQERLTSRDGAPTGSGDRLHELRWNFDAGRQLRAWVALAFDAHRRHPISAPHPEQPLPLADNGRRIVSLGQLVSVDVDSVPRGPHESVVVSLEFTAHHLVCGVRVRRAGRTLAEGSFPAGSATGATVVLAGDLREGQDGLGLELLADPVLHLASLAGIRLDIRMQPGPRFERVSEDSETEAYILPHATPLSAGSAPTHLPLLSRSHTP